MPDKLTRERILEATTHRNNGCKIPVVTKFQNHPVTVTFLWQDEFRRDDAGLGPHSSSFSRIHPSRDSNVSMEGGGRRDCGRGLARDQEDRNSAASTRLFLVSTETSCGAVHTRVFRHSVQIPISFIFL